MATAERMCDRIFMIFRGRKVLDGTLEEIQDDYGARHGPRAHRRGAAALAGMPGVEAVNDFGQMQEVRLHGDPQVFLQRLVGAHRGLSLRGHAAVAARYLRAHRQAVVPAHHEQDLDRRAIGVRHARAEQGVSDQPRADADRDGRIGDARSRHQGHEGHQGSNVCARRLHRRGGRAAEGACRDVQRRHPLAAGRRSAAQRRALYSGRDQAVGRSAEQLRLELSNRVRKQEFFAFVEFPADVLDPAANGSIRYYSDHPSYNALPQWIRATVNAVVMNERFRRASVDRALVVRLTKQAPIDELGLVRARTPTAGSRRPRKSTSRGPTVFRSRCWR